MLESEEVAITSGIRVENLDHLGIVAGLIDEIGIVELLNERLGIDPRERVSIGVVVKAMLLNGLGFVSAPLYLFEEFFKGKATEQLLGTGIKAEHLNDDRLGKALDELYATGLSDLFLSVSLQAAQRFEVKIETAHLDSTSFHVDGEYEETTENPEPEAVKLRIFQRPSTRPQAIRDELNLCWGRRYSGKAVATNLTKQNLLGYCKPLRSSGHLKAMHRR